MKKRKIWLLLTAILIILVLTVCGCGKKKENNNKKSEIIELITCANNSVYLIIINLKDLKTTIKGHNLSHINLIHIVVSYML